MTSDAPTRSEAIMLGEPLTLFPRRRSAIVLLVLSTAFVAVGIWMARTGESFGYASIACFGLGIPIAVIQLLPGSTFLRIDENGITFANLFRKTSLPWSAFDRFVVVVIRKGGLKAHEMVGFDFAPTYDRAKVGRAIAHALAGCEGALPDTYGRKADDLAALLNARLREAQLRRQA
jgi:hypothetical protein